MSGSSEPAARILIVGGSGAVGRAIAHDLLRYTPHRLVIASRSEARGKAVAADLGPRVEHRVLRLAADGGLRPALRGVSLAIMAAGPYRKMPPTLAAACVREGISYLDLSDNREFTARVLDLSPEARRAGVTLLTGVGLFPGLASILVRMGAERLDAAEQVRLVYAVRGPGGFGTASLRSAFASVGRPFTMLVDGQWKGFTTFDDPEVVALPAPFGRTRVYAFEFAGLGTLAATFGLRTLTTKLGVVPDAVNRVGRLLGRALPKPLLSEGPFVNLLVGPASRIARWSERIGGGAVLVRAEVVGRRGRERRAVRAWVVQPSAVAAAAASAGAAATLLVDGVLREPGAHPPERAVPVEPYLAALGRRGVEVELEEAAAPDAVASAA